MTRRAYILSAAGPAGAWQAGIVDQLAKRGITPDVCYGTSSGAFNAAFIAYYAADRLADIWTDSMSGAFKKYVKWNLNPFAEGFVNFDALVPYLEKKFEASPETHCMSFVRFVDMSNGYKWTRGSDANASMFAKAVVSSGSIPVIVEPIKNDAGNRTYADGGITDILFTDMIDTTRYDDVYVFNAHPKNTGENWKPSWPYKLSRGWRSIVLQYRENIAADMQILREKCRATGTRIIEYRLQADVPKFDFGAENLRKLVELGRNAEPEG